jgi:transcription-repair coupling factor (superfamily II helicase)
VLEKEESLDVDTIIEVLVSYGFVRVDFVYEPGQFSIRGGIIDIFSYGSEWPYRIELFDDEIETIRSFNPTNQLSIRAIKKVSIIPNVNSKFSQDDKVSLLNVIPEGSLVWIKDYDFFLDKIQICFEKAGEFARTFHVEDEALKEALNTRSFIFPKDITEDLEHHHQLHYKVSSFQKTFEHTLDFSSSPQPHFNKNFSLLIEDLNKNTKDNLTNYIFTENVKQIERFYNIFEDLDAHVKFVPVHAGLHAGFIDRDLQVVCYTDHEIFERFHKYTLRKGFTKEQAVNLKMLRELQPGDFVTHIDHGVGRYSGLEKINIAGHVQESLRIFYKNNDVLYVSINSLHKITKYVGKDGTAPALSKIGGDAWKALKRKTKKRVKDIAKGLIQLYATRKASEGFAFPADGYLQNELEASFLYEDTPDQEKATQDVKEDMMKPYPMDRLICGDVGFGKTEVAIRGAFKAVVAGKQVAILVPTTILALQHYQTFQDRLQDFGVTVDYINRFRTAKEKTKIFERLKAGEIDVVIGTHGLLNNRVGFKDLGLLVIDEEQKFGVAAKEKLRNIKVNVDTLTLTATPIPRTLQFSLMAARDLSIIRTPPPNRQPIHTERRIIHEELIRDAIYYEINRGGQVFFVHNRVRSLPDITAMIRRLCPDLDIAMAHGQMESKALEKTLLDFIHHKHDVLVSTNIIETGLDIPNANTIIINNAQNFGLSDLHQLRGRVGRSNKKAFCYLFAPPLSVLTSDARKRLKILEDFSELGSGFNIAMRDLDIRGAGNLLGGEQSGFISDIGYETYQKILEEAIQELKETDFKDLFKEDLEKEREYVRDVEIETETEMLIPDAYVSVIQERLNLYTKLDNIENQVELDKFKLELADRFGPIPKQVNELFNGLRLRWLCKKMGFERISLKGNKLRAYFVRNPQSSFYETSFFQNVLAYVAKQGVRKGITLKQSKNFLILIKEDVRSLTKAQTLLQRIYDQCKEDKDKSKA